MTEPSKDDARHPICESDAELEDPINPIADGDAYLPLGGPGKSDAEDRSEHGSAGNLAARLLQMGGGNGEQTVRKVAEMEPTSDSEPEVGDEEVAAVEVVTLGEGEFEDSADTEPRGAESVSEDSEDEVDAEVETVSCYELAEVQDVNPTRVEIMATGSEERNESAEIGIEIKVEDGELISKEGVDTDDEVGEDEFDFQVGEVSRSPEEILNGSAAEESQKSMLARRIAEQKKGPDPKGEEAQEFIQREEATTVGRPHQPGISDSVRRTFSEARIRRLQSDQEAEAYRREAGALRKAQMRIIEGETTVTPPILPPPFPTQDLGISSEQPPSLPRQVPTGEVDEQVSPELREVAAEVARALELGFQPTVGATFRALRGVEKNSGNPFMTGVENPLQMRSGSAPDPDLPKYPSAPPPTLPDQTERQPSMVPDQGSGFSAPLPPVMPGPSPLPVNPVAQTVPPPHLPPPLPPEMVVHPPPQRPVSDEPNEVILSTGVEAKVRAIPVSPTAPETAPPMMPSPSLKPNLAPPPQEAPPQMELPQIAPEQMVPQQVAPPKIAPEQVDYSAVSNVESPTSAQTGLGSGEEVNSPSVFPTSEIPADFLRPAVSPAEVAAAFGGAKGPVEKEEVEQAINLSGDDELTRNESAVSGVDESKTKTVLPERRPEGLPPSNSQAPETQGSRWPQLGTPTTALATGTTLPEQTTNRGAFSLSRTGDSPASLPSKPAAMLPPMHGVPDQLPGGSPMGGSRRAPLLVALGMGLLVVGIVIFGLYLQGYIGGEKRMLKSAPVEESTPGFETESPTHIPDTTLPEVFPDVVPILPPVGDPPVTAIPETFPDESEIPAALPDWTQPVIDARGVPVTTEHPEPERALRLFMAAPDWQTRLRYSQSPARVAGKMRAYYKANRDSSIGILSVALKVPGSTGSEKNTAFIFEVKTVGAKKAYPVSVLDVGDGEFRVDWEPFVQCQDGLLEEFAKTPQPGVGEFYVLLKRAQWTPEVVPSPERLLAFYALPPHLGARDIKVYLPESSELGAQLDEVLGWESGYFRVVELGWEKTGSGHDYLRLRRIVAESWGARD